MQNRNRFTDRENKLMATKGESCRESEIRSFELTYTHYYVEKNNQSTVQDSNYTQHFIITHKEKNLKKDTLVCINESLCWIPETNSTL